MQGYPSFFDDEAPTHCAECAVELPETNDTGFCCDAHAKTYCDREREADDLYAKALVDEAKYAAQWQAELTGAKATDTFEVPARLQPSTALGLALTHMFMTTPAHERV